ncbi:hypothetical protein M0R72_07270 [Candidatus Pacearchaeota archaeon]|jgi:hypothetical protein|nr:hypothetical protein [Candidatus Pacearchaeota archaeon]
MQQRYLLRSDIPNLIGPQGIPGGTLSWKGEYGAGTTYAANDGAIFGGRAFYALQETTGNDPPTYPDTENAYWSLYAEKGTDGASGIKTIWADMPGLPSRVSDTSFRIVDTSNANGYDLIFSAGTIISWEKSGGGWQAAKIISASYAANYVTFELKGNTISAGFTGMKYCIHRAQEDCWTIPGNMPIAAQTNIGKILSWREDRYVFSTVVVYQTAPTTTKGVWDINDDGTSVFATKPEIAAAATEATATVAVAAKSKISLDYDSGHATTPGADAYIYIWSMPVAWRYTE